MALSATMNTGVPDSIATLSKGHLPGSSPRKTPSSSASLPGYSRLLSSRPLGHLLKHTHYALSRFAYYRSPKMEGPGEESACLVCQNLRAEPRQGEREKFQGSLESGMLILGVTPRELELARWSTAYCPGQAWLGM